MRLVMALFSLGILSLIPSTSNAIHEFWINPTSGACYSYDDGLAGGTTFPDFSLHVGDASFAADSRYTYLFTLTLWWDFTPYSGHEIRQMPDPAAPGVPPKRYPLTWCEMTDSVGQTLFSVGNKSVEQLKLNLSCECIRLGTCTTEVSCRPENPDVRTIIDEQISVPYCH